METPRLTLITGGARSGKSSHALTIATAYPGNRRYFIASAEPSDDEMHTRIERHRADRSAGFVTIEEPVALARVIASLDGRADVLVLDCLTLWVANLMARDRDDLAVMAEADGLIGALTRVTFGAVVVTGEVGAGIVPMNPAARRFRDLLGWINQKVARASDRVLLMTAGYPLIVK
jgi:adenosylcobinamide kinase/adenosylcobinamide-phosphate guanylyltransferase